MTMSLGNGTVLCDIDSRGVVTVTLNRPDVNNAYNGDMLCGLHEAMDALPTLPQARVVVIRGNGRHFQAGADLKWIAGVGQKGPQANRDASFLTGDAVRRLDRLELPTVALVQGGCFGGGTGVISACDVVIAADNALFAITEVRWGLNPSIIIPQLCQAMGARNVRRYALTCERFGSQTAQQLGLVHEVCPADALDATGDRVVDALLLSAPLALKAVKRRTMQVADALFDDALFNDLVDEHARFRQQAEGAEGTASFIEKRNPAWYPGPKAG